MNKQFFLLSILVVLIIACDFSAKNNADKSQIYSTNLPQTSFNKPLTDSLIGQNFIHKYLSNSFDFCTTIKRIQLKEVSDSCIVALFVKNKKSNKLVFSVLFSSTYLLGDSIFISDNVRSYSTGKKENAEVEDNDFGDIVVGDFNFDNQRRLCIKKSTRWKWWSNL